MREIGYFFTNIFSNLLSRMQYSVTSTAERKLRESVEQGYDRAVESRKSKQEQADDHSV
jgi:hypothetical protein